ncbi:hypothetical protein NKJ48_14230 [Mesorhizobium sp. M0114]|uniref:hypothetical protein n=1 Tax=unclassified Mesorhizobium TaxID=325217 RepID=UPI00333B6D95
MSFIKLAFASAFMLASALPVQASCQAADILFGPVRLDIIRYDGYETAVVRSATFDDPKKNYGAILGELTVDRGGFSIRTPDQVVVGTISPELRIKGWDDSCDTKSVAEIVTARAGTFIILNSNRPVGTIEGRFPKNDFGVR